MAAFSNRKIYIYNQYCYLRIAALHIFWAQLKVPHYLKIQSLLMSKGMYIGRGFIPDT